MYLVPRMRKAQIVRQVHAEAWQRKQEITNNMVVFNPLLLFVALAHFAPFVSTQPLDPNTTPSLSERADVCYNAPGTKAGS